VIDLVAKAKALVQERDKLENERATKRRRLVDVYDSCDSSKSKAMGIDGCDSCHRNNGDKATSGPMPPQLAPGYSIWWDSMDAD
jgi:cytochrome c553